MVDKPRILVVEDEEAIRTGLVDVLIYHGFKVDFAEEGNTGLALACSGKFDLVLLDVMLPGVDGFSICDAVREQDPELPIIMLTAKGSDEDIIQGLKLGADDYITKPFSVAQLVLRIKAVLRRVRPENPVKEDIVLANGAHLNPPCLSGKMRQQELSFTKKEMEILVYLYQHRARAVERDELLNKVWGYDKQAAIETRTVDIHIAKLRRKLEMDPKVPKVIVTVRGAGYRLCCEEI